MQRSPRGEKRRCYPGCTAERPCHRCPCVPFDPIVGHTCDLALPDGRLPTYYSTSYVARTLAGIAVQADTLRTLGIEVPVKSDCLWMRLPNGQQFRAWVQEVRSTDPDYRIRHSGHQEAPYLDQPKVKADHGWYQDAAGPFRPTKPCEECGVPWNEHGTAKT